MDQLAVVGTPVCIIKEANDYTEVLLYSVTITGWVGSARQCAANFQNRAPLEILHCTTFRKDEQEQEKCVT